MLGLQLLEATVAFKSVYGWFYALQEVEKFFEEKQEVILSFCFLFALDVADFSGVDTVCYFITLPLWCLCVYVFECK